ncbi:hypothetical protein EGW08_022459 [Elysia chlorotica]|uniref:Uncharacterized protein n=1 Tax=Elysia chlorotica TaxID=188477 RepID=A0A433SKY3_ELYCH|nr:hypothetical protein EGW08_022459 [Elysia chlorotica]
MTGHCRDHICSRHEGVYLLISYGADVIGIGVLVMVSKRLHRFCLADPSVIIYNENILTELGSNHPTTLRPCTICRVTAGHAAAPLLRREDGASGEAGRLATCADRATGGPLKEEEEEEEDRTEPDAVPPLPATGPFRPGVQSPSTDEVDRQCGEEVSGAWREGGPGLGRHGCGGVHRAASLLFCLLSRPVDMVPHMAPESQRTTPQLPLSRRLILPKSDGHIPPQPAVPSQGQTLQIINEVSPVVSRP